MLWEFYGTKGYLKGLKGTWMSYVPNSQQVATHKWVLFPNPEEKILSIKRGTSWDMPSWHAKEG